MKYKGNILITTLIALIIISAQCLRAEPNGLLVYYSFDEAYGTTVFDTSGNNYDGTISLASRVEGKDGGGLLFGADDARVSVAAWALELPFYNSLITIEAWIKPSRMKNGETYRIIGGRSLDDISFQIRDGRLEVCYGGNSIHYGLTKILVDIWTRIVFTSDGKNITTYINSVLDKSSNITLPIRVFGGIIIGAHRSYSSEPPHDIFVEEFPGIIDEFKIWERSYTASPVISGMSTTFTRSNEFYCFTPTASDPYDEELTFSITGKPDWATFSTTTGRLSGTPTTADIDHYGPITITVRDSDWNTDSLLPFNLRVISDDYFLPGVYFLLQNK